MVQILRKKDRWWWTGVFSVSLAAVILVSGFAFALKGTMEQVAEKDIKLSLLIDEVGDIRAELEEKDHALKTLSASMDQAQVELWHVSEKIDAATVGDADAWEDLREDIGVSQEHLASILQDKEDALQQSLAVQKDLQLRLAAAEDDVHTQVGDDHKLHVLVVGHNEGLTDTIMVVTIDESAQEISFVSIPRDLSYKGRKINELYKRYGIEELQRAVVEITGLKPDKYALFDFVSFEQIIDELGGIVVDVPVALLDTQYPGQGNSSMTVSFDAGVQEMDGARALQYVRSRKSTSDFDRAKRQQQVIAAVRARIQEVNLLYRLDMAVRLYAHIQNNFKSDIGLFEGLSYIQKSQGYQFADPFVLSSANFLYSTKNSRGQYILLPREGDYSAVKEFLNN